MRAFLALALEIRAKEVKGSTELQPFVAEAARDACCLLLNFRKDPYRLYAVKIASCAFLMALSKSKTNRFRLSFNAALLPGTHSL